MVPDGSFLICKYLYSIHPVSSHCDCYMFTDTITIFSDSHILPLQYNAIALQRVSKFPL
jgi:hypothetical protein